MGDDHRTGANFPSFLVENDLAYLSGSEELLMAPVQGPGSNTMDSFFSSLETKGMPSIELGMGGVEPDARDQWQQPEVPVARDAVPSSAAPVGGGGGSSAPSEVQISGSPLGGSTEQQMNEGAKMECENAPARDGKFQAYAAGGSATTTRFSSQQMMSALPSAKVEKGLTDARIQKFDNSTKTLIGYEDSGAENIRRTLARQLKFDERTEISLGRPSVFPGSNLFVVGTDNPDCKQNFLLCLDADAIYKSKAPIKSIVPVSEHIRDTHWIMDNVILCAKSQDVHIIQMQKEDLSLKIRGTRSLHHDLIREIAPNPSKPMEIASGGYDKKLCIHDLRRGVKLHEQATSDTIGSVKWHQFSRATLGCTLDYGGMMMFDSRIGFSKPSFKMNTGKPDLYTHCAIDNNSVLLGYGDGSLQLIDQRYDKKIILRTQDPYVEGVGDIVYNASSQSFVVSGLTDFTVWKLGRDSTAYPWSHSETTKNSIANKTGYATAAAFLDADTVICCDRVGQAAVFKQKFLHE